ncbi:hypothetical protein A0H81_09518 [Grifola frondosa]|uniref:Uncharacterized protein n=1 Tax=Grifola frondosa TaxID=5627 RepID=A0A1C7M231_GRIFR|nr:hypothetical protein A0H81_09518 [Grifola frondosa]
MLSMHGGGHPGPPVHLLLNTKFRFFPLAPYEQLVKVYTDANSQLLELVILANSPDCPDLFLCHSNGHYHTNNLFVGVMSSMHVNLTDSSQHEMGSKKK